MEKPTKNFTSFSLRETDERVKNFLKNSTKNFLETLAMICGTKINELKNMHHTKNMSFDNHLDTRASSKKFITEIKINEKNKNLLKWIYILITLKNLNSLKE